MKEFSPFSPGKIVPADFFVGREKELASLKRGFGQVAAGRNEYVFLTGERGLGKSSLASLLRNMAISSPGVPRLLGVHCFLGGANDLKTGLKFIIQSMIEEAAAIEGIWDRIEKLVEKYVKDVQVNLLGTGIKVEFKQDEKLYRDLNITFLQEINSLFNNVKNNFKGLLLILDDLNGITKDENFANFLKSLIDKVETNPKSNVPLYLLLSGLEERMEDIRKKQPSAPRIFRQIELQPMNEKESSDFFNKAFQSVGHVVDKEALEYMVVFSAGFPVLLHEIGDAVFWMDTDEKITKSDAVDGIIEASQTIGVKYLDRKFYKEIRSDKYRDILKEIAVDGWEFSRAEALKSLSEEKVKVFDNFINGAKKLGLIRTKERGMYELVNPVFWLYFAVKRIQSKK